jgi:hypothetical protein
VKQRIQAIHTEKICFFIETSAGMRFIDFLPSIIIKRAKTKNLSAKQEINF